MKLVKYVLYAGLLIPFPAKQHFCRIQYIQFFDISLFNVERTSLHYFQTDLPAMIPEEKANMRLNPPQSPLTFKTSPAA